MCPKWLTQKPTEPTTADHSFTDSTPRTCTLKFSRAIKMMEQLLDRLTKFKRNEHPSMLVKPTIARKYPIANNVQRVRVALKRVWSYRMNSDRTKPASRAIITVSNQVALLESFVLFCGLIALWSHSREPKSWLLFIALIIVVAVVTTLQILCLMHVPSTGISQHILSTVNFTLPYVR